MRIESEEPTHALERQARLPIPRTLGERIRGFGILAVATLIGQALGLLALAIATRHLTTTDIGAYTFCVAIVAYLTLPVEFGAASLAIRDIASGGVRRRQVASEMLTLQLGMGAILYVGVLVVAPIIGPDALVSHILPVVGVTLLTTALAFDWALQAEGRPAVVAFWRLTSQLLYFGLVFLLLPSGQNGTYAFAAFNVCGYFIFASGTLLSYVKLYSWPGFASPKAALLRLRRGLTIGYAYVMIQIYYYLDATFLEYYRGSKEVGIYGIAYKLPLAFMVLAQLWTKAVVPHAARMFPDALDRLRQDLRRSTTAAVVLALGISVGAATCAQNLMPAVFGVAYAAAATPFTILAVASGVVLVATNIGPVLVAIGGERQFAIATTFAAILNLTANVVLIPHFGADGAAIATVIAELAVLSYMSARLHSTVGLASLDLKRVARGAAVACFTGAAGWAAQPYIGAWGQVALYTVLFVILGVLSGAFDRTLLNRPQVGAQS